MKIRKENKLRDWLTDLLSCPFKCFTRRHSEIEDESYHPLIAKRAAQLFISQAAPFVYLFLSLLFATVLLQPTIEVLIQNVQGIPMALFEHNIIPAITDATTLFSTAELMSDEMVDLVDRKKGLHEGSIAYSHCVDAVRDLRGFVWIVRLVAAALATLSALGFIQGVPGMVFLYVVLLLIFVFMMFASWVVADSDEWVELGHMIDSGLSSNEKNALEE